MDSICVEGLVIFMTFIYSIGHETVVTFIHD